jgi:hypothetical protein
MVGRTLLGTKHERRSGSLSVATEQYTFMNFKPASEEEIAANGVWPAGPYAFVILEAEEKLSASKGNPMIELRIEISRRDGKKRIVRDYLLPQRQDKLLHAAKACDVLERYNAGQLLADNFIGKTGSLRLAIQRSRGFPPKNVVEDYVTAKSGLAKAPPVRGNSANA